MKNTNRRIVAIVGCLILSNAGLALAQDWPQWRGPNRDGKVTGFTAPETWPKALVQKWQVTVGAGDATPALVGDKLYAFARQGDDEVTLCLDADSGKELWKDKNPTKAITGPAARLHPGPRGSPAVADGKVVTLGVTGTLTCLESATGKVLWRKDMFPNAVPRFFTGMSPMIVDGMVITQLGSETDGATIALDLATGNEKWKWAAQGTAYASPVVMTVDGTKQIVTLTSKSLVGLNLTDGKLLWEVPFAPQGMAYNAATPIVDGQTVIFTGQGRGTKAVDIEKQGDGFAAKELWSNGNVAVQFSTPVLKDGLLFGLTEKGFLFCIDAKTGKDAWTDTVRRGGAFAAMLEVGTAIIALPNTGELIAFKPVQTGYTELANIKVADKPTTYAHPVIAGKKVFVKDQDTLTLWTFE